jgi:perosamine synthetase
MPAAYEILEREYAEFLSVSPRQCVACSSGTAALHLSLEAMRFPAGSGVLVPDFTMVACARAVTLAGLTPIFVDCTPELLIDLALVEAAIAASPVPVVAIMPVHIYGRRCPMASTTALAQHYGLAVIEDSAEAHTIDPHPASDAVCWSFYKNKIIAGEEGGMVYFYDEELATLARRLRSLGFTDHHDFMHIPRGHNYRLANLLAQEILDGPNGLRAVTRNVAIRQQVEDWYDAVCPGAWKMPARDVPWVYDIRIPSLNSLSPGALSRLVTTLRAQRIDARHGFKPMSSQPEYRTPAVLDISNIRLPGPPPALPAQLPAPQPGPVYASRPIGPRVPCLDRVRGRTRRPRSAVSADPPRSAPARPPANVLRGRKASVRRANRPLPRLATTRPLQLT